MNACWRCEAVEQRIYWASMPVHRHERVKDRWGKGAVKEVVCKAASLLALWRGSLSALTSTWDEAHAVQAQEAGGDAGERVDWEV